MNPLQLTSLSNFVEYDLIIIDLFSQKINLFHHIFADFIKTDEKRFDKRDI